MKSNYKQLHRSLSNRMIAGVCGGLGEYSNLDPTLIRLSAVALLLMTGPVMVLAYVLGALIIPEGPAQTQ